MEIDVRACFNLHDYIADVEGTYLGMQRARNPAWVTDTRDLPREYLTYAWAAEIAGLMFGVEVRDARYYVPTYGFPDDPSLSPASRQTIRIRNRTDWHRAVNRGHRHHWLHGSGWTLAWIIESGWEADLRRMTACLGSQGAVEDLTFTGSEDAYRRDMTAVTMTLPRRLYGRTDTRYGGDKDEAGWYRTLTNFRLPARLA